MILSMQGQAFVFLAAVVTGFACGFVFDLFRVFRKAIRHGTILTQIEDAIFWVLAAFIVFYVMFTLNEGEVRAFSVLGAFLGMVLYFSTISRVIMKVSSKIIEMIKKVLRKFTNSVIIGFCRCKQFFSPVVNNELTKKLALKFSNKGEET